MVVFCTGFERDARSEAAKIVGEEIGKKLEQYWGIDEEGELRGVYKPMSCKSNPFLGEDDFLTGQQILVSGTKVEVLLGRGFIQDSWLCRSRRMLRVRH